MAKRMYITEAVATGPLSTKVAAVKSANTTSTYTRQSQMKISMSR